MVIDTGTVAFLVAILVQTAGIGKTLLDVHGIKSSVDQANDGINETNKAVHGLDTRLSVVETKINLLPCGAKCKDD